jgi:hypothetical protein
MEPRTKRRSLRHLLVPLACLACAALFLKGVSRSWHREDGFTSLIRFGSKFDERSLDTLKAVPHVVLPESYGYDGQFYVQLALDPLLNDPQLTRAIDNVAYRSRRILFSWTAWLLGAGKPAWVIQAYAVQNLIFWLAGAILLFSWLPPRCWFDFLRWAAILFSAGWVDSVTHALLDGPALFLLLLSVWLCERGRPIWGAALLGVSALGKETNLLAGPMLFDGLRLDRQGIKTFLLRSLLLVLPFALWLGFIQYRFGLHGSAGSRNFGLPLVGWVGKCRDLMSAVSEHGWLTRYWLTALCVIGTLVQMAYFVSRWDFSNRWWRIGLAYTLLGLCLGAAVLEGTPGAFARTLLPLAAAFNLSLQPTWKGWLLLPIGNLGVLQGLNALGLVGF